MGMGRNIMNCQRCHQPIFWNASYHEWNHNKGFPAYFCKTDNLLDFQGATGEEGILPVWDVSQSFTLGEYEKWKNWHETVYNKRIDE